MINIALLCTNPSPTLRPSMSSVVSMLEGKIAVQAPIIKRDTVDQEARFKAFERLSHDSITSISTSSQGIPMQKSMLLDGPWADSTTSSTQNKDETEGYSSTRNLL